MPGDLNARLLAAHAADDRAALIDLYAEASEAATQITPKRFYLTHAYVFALEAGRPEAAYLRARLVELGAETPD